MTGINYSILTGLCVGSGTIVFFLLFQKGGPLSAVPAILAVGAAMMALAGIFFFKEQASPLRLLGVVLSIAGLLLLRLEFARETALNLFTGLSLRRVPACLLPPVALAFCRRLLARK